MRIVGIGYLRQAGRDDVRLDWTDEHPACYKNVGVLSDETGALVDAVRLSAWHRVHGTIVVVTQDQYWRVVNALQLAHNSTWVKVDETIPGPNAIVV